MPDQSAAVSAAHIEVALTAIRAAFGHDRIDAIAHVSGGASGALPFRILIRDEPYLVRIEGPKSPLRNPHQYESMRIASEHGISPRVYYFDEMAGVAVMDFVEEQPLTSYPGGRLRLAEAVGDMLRRLRETPPFPRFVVYTDIVGRLWAWVCRSGLFAAGMLDPYTERFHKIRETYVSDSNYSVSCHNDLVPRNILFDGSRLWFIDWESAYRNDPLVDIAVALDNLTTSPEMEDSMLRALWGEAPGEEVLQRLGDVRALTRLYYAGVFLSASFAGSGALADNDLHAPALDDLRDLMLDRRNPLRTTSIVHILGKMYLASFLSDTLPPPLDAQLLLNR